MKCGGKAMNTLELEKPHILLVEDDELIGSFLAEVLGEWGFHCAGPVSDIFSALYKAETERIDAALLDVILLDQHDYEVMEALEARGIPFGFLSAMPRGALPLKWSGHPFLEKPCGESAILKMLQFLLATGGTPLLTDQSHSIA
jgi:DNA-binding response OmpR family regulator